MHPGDILVWWHYKNGFAKDRTGGHTHTIAAVERDKNGELVDLTLLQGNEPLHAEQKADIHTYLSKKNPKQAQPTDKTLGEAPGRRIEKAKASTSWLEFRDSNPKTDKSPAPIWIWKNDTLLVAAGPPKSAARPAAAAPAGKKGPATRSLTDWTSALRSAPATDLAARVEAMLFEARATLEANGALIETQARAVGAAAGARVWELGKKAQDLANASHFKLMQEILDIMSAFQESRGSAGDNPTTQYDQITKRLITQLGWIRQAFEMAARGISDIAFAPGKGASTDQVNVLVTGFDPFDKSGNLQRPGAGNWNPSGSAALALDGQRLPITGSKGAKGVAAVEGLVLPVSYDAFKGGIVEQAIGPHAKQLDAVLTVSEDPTLPATGPVRLERYAVGAHLIDGKVEGIPAAGGGGAAGPAIIESRAPLDAIATATQAPATKGAPAVQTPAIGDAITFDFGSAAKANAALAALGLPPGSLATATISDNRALHQIIKTMRRTGTSTTITFEAGVKSFSANVVSGPGGSFLSNEVSFRALRLLAGSPSPKDPISFHTHTQASNIIPDDSPSAAGKKLRTAALAAAMALRSTVVATLKRLIGAVGRLVLDKRPPQKK